MNKDDKQLITNVEGLQHTLAEIADRLQWGKVLYEVQKIVLKSGYIHGYNLLVFPYELQMVELFHKQRILNQVVVNEDNEEINYQDYYLSGMNAYNLKRESDVEDYLLKIALDRRVMPYDIQKVVKDYKGE